jgi:hypothetical protein
MSNETSVERFTACAHICRPQCSKQYLAVKASDYDALQAELAEFLAENERLTRALALADRALEQAIADRARETTT